MSTPKWFTIVAVLALLWNALGCLAIGMNLMMSEADLKSLSEGERAIHAALPAWSVVASVVAVVFGLLGSIGLVAKKAWSSFAFALSLLGIILQIYSLFGLANGLERGGQGVVIAQSMVLLIGVGLLWLSHLARARGWLT
jgi:hypothetical protein